MDEFTEGTSSEGISRRTVIKRAGVVGAVAWTAPVLSSLGAKAFAGTPVECAGCDPQEPCTGQTPCGDTCTCLAEEGTGACFCHEISSCSALQTCSGPGQCPRGFVCARSCCDNFGFPPLCIPNCANPDAVAVRAVRGQGMTTAG